MPHVVVDLDSDISPGRVLAAATDFSKRRPELWPNISPGFWQLHDRGPNWAEATEGSHVRVDLDRRWKGKGWLFSPSAALFGRQMFTRNLQKTLRVLEGSRS
jgi:hypothetical protein